METKKKLISIKEAAQLVGRSYWKLREAALSGDLPASRFGVRGKLYIKPSDLDRWIDDHSISIRSG